MMTRDGVHYERVRRSSSHADEAIALLHVDDGDRMPHIQLPQASASEKRARAFLIASLGILAVSICSLVSSVLLYRRPTLLQSAQLVSPYSPLWDVVEFWDGDFVNYFNHSTIYRGLPTFEREKAWDNLWNRPSPPFPDDWHGLDTRLANILASTHTFIGVDSARVSELNRVDHGQFIPVIGSDPRHPIYAAEAEVFHQLHCLYLIRQYTWPLELFDLSWGDVYPELLTDTPVAVRMHVDHCIETLRISLMCYSDVTPMFIEKAPERVLGHQRDFNPYHKCRNFDKIAQYVDEKDYDIVLPPGKKTDD